MSEVWTVLPRPEEADWPTTSLGAGVEMMLGLTFKRSAIRRAYGIGAALASFFQEFLPWREISEVGAKY